jgi:Cu/Ag efflux protein CusF
MRRVLTFVSAVAMSAGLAQFAAAQNPPSPPPPTEQPSTPPASDPNAQSPSASASHAMKMSGELLSVDPTTKMLTIKSDDGRESKFSYNDQTVISGVKEQAAGLATAAGSKVTVEYTGSGDSMVATKIKVTPKKTS